MLMFGIRRILPDDLPSRSPDNIRAVDDPNIATPARRLNLGCGFDHRPGYLNVDFQEFHKPDLVADVRDLSALPSDSCEAVLAIDVLEHLERADVVPALREWNRVLCPGGTLHLRTVDVMGVARLMAERDTVADHHHLIHCLFGTQAYTGDYHLAGFTDLTLVDHLYEAGFDRVRISRHHGWLFVVDARRAADSSQEDLIALSLDGRFYDQESAGAETWNWCRSSAGILFVNQAPETASVRLDLTVSRSGQKGKLELIGPGGRQNAKIKDRTTLHFPLSLPSGPTRTTLISHSHPISAPDDPRSLHMCLHEAVLAAT
jgi:SAM-dependent methyltransferase